MRRRLCSQYAAGWPRLLTIQHLHIVQFTHNKTQNTRHNTIKNTMPKVQSEVSMPLDGHTFFLYNQLQNHVQQQKHNVLYTTYNLKYYKSTNVFHGVAHRHNVYPVCRMATPDPSAISSVCHSAVTPSPLPSLLDGWLRMARMKVKVNLTIIKVMLIPFSVWASKCAMCSDIRKIMAQESPRITNTVSFNLH